jgi:MoaA/NifB/PqqE/SkfB family radical SAM enzyme
VVLTGGEPLMHRDLAAICQRLRLAGIRVTVLTTGLLLPRYAERAADLFDEVIISIDGPPDVHNRIRGVERAFEKISAAARLLRSCAPLVTLRARTTVQKANRNHLRQAVQSARQLELDSISFLAADLTSEAFNRKLIWPVARQNEIGLTPAEIGELEREIEALIAEHATEITSGFIVESPTKLRRIVRHFRAHAGLESPQSPICNAPWKSAVIELDGSVRPCFFQPALGSVEQGGLGEVLNSAEALGFRAQLDIGSNSICQHCVCSLNYRAS